MREAAPFLRAEWRWLAMVNYEIEPAILLPHVPVGTELDLWSGRAYVSLVGFLFLNTRVMGLPIPFHRDFEEVNLRFYVRREAEDGWRRGVVFVKEIVPRWAIGWVARTFYGENYVSLPMRHRIAGREVEYGWRFNGRWCRLGVISKGEPEAAAAGSEEQFITEHYWGYAAQGDGGCVEYRVEHPSWRIWPVAESMVEVPVAALYGAEFEDALGRKPASAFLAEGSAVTVFWGRRVQGAVLNPRGENLTTCART